MAILYSQAVGQNISDIYSDLSLRAYGPREEESEGHPRAPGKGLRPLHP